MAIIDKIMLQFSYKIDIRYPILFSNIRTLLSHYQFNGKLDRPEIKMNILI